MSKELIVFYSRANENYVNGIIKNLSVGNTEVAAGIINKITGADLFKIEEIKPYSKEYNECISQARSDQKRNARPELKNYPKSIEKYDVIYLGYPNYWGTMPMAVFTFLEKFDFKGKTIRPFCTHEGSGFGRSLDDIKKLCQNSNVAKGLSIRGENVKDSENKIKNWIKEE